MDQIRGGQTRSNHTPAARAEEAAARAREATARAERKEDHAGERRDQLFIWGLTTAGKIACDYMMNSNSK
jgi:hypothetical protein